ncbi:MAG: ABC transporter ATP-binding protein [Pseudomonadota bacterium]|nr:ABC transporter ATP-binding protein [Pseudomonadota bacterium]
MISNSGPLLTVEDLRVGFRAGKNWTDAVHGVSFEVNRGETFCIVGESGSGKSVTSLSVLGLLPADIAKITGGSVTMEGRRLDTLDEAEMNRVRGRDIGMIFQEPMTSLNPVHRVGEQIAEALRIHEGLSKKAATARALEMLDMVQIPDAKRRITAFPHELSGGMRQRVMIAMALACKPRLLIADEPTTALDVTVQAQILSLMNELKTESGTSIILITHDMGVVAEMADRVAVFQHGRKVEEGSVGTVLKTPQHDYTKALLAATPKIGSGSWRDGRRLAEVSASSAATGDIPEVGSQVILEAVDLGKKFGGGRSILGKERPAVNAVDGVSFKLRKGETLAVVGESGCGKSTLARMLMLSIPASRGSMILAGREARDLSGEALRQARRDIQMVFQDPYASLHPQMTARQIVAEPLVNLAPEMTAEAREEKIGALFERCGLSREMMDRYPFEFSGGQRQRLAIARAIILNPAVVVADEPVSALDVSVQAQVLNLMAELQADLGLSYVFISHDLSVVEFIADRVAVMYLGKVVELAPRAALFRKPLHPYSAALFDSVPSLDVDNRRLTRERRTGELPSPMDLPSGCRFRTRCPFATELCAREEPPLVAPDGGDHQVACHYPGEAQVAALSDVA